jgi:hypothetical protein
MKKILIQLDTDPHPSVFDRVVAVDAGADELFSYGGVEPDGVRDLVYGAIFTRGPKDLQNTAVFVGGTDLPKAEKILAAARAAFFGPMRVSLMLDCGGCNTTAAAAVLCARKQIDLKRASALVLGATGPVGQRAVRLLALEGAHVRVGSRSRDRAASVCDRLSADIPHAGLEPVATGAGAALTSALEGIGLVIAAGAEGVQLLPADARKACTSLQVAIDLNAVPPAGIEGIEATDKAADREGVRAYGAIGVGGTKMKIHKAALARLFESNDQVFDVEEIYALGKQMS